MKSKTFYLKLLMVALVALLAKSNVGEAVAAEQQPLIIGAGGVSGAYYPAGGAVASLVNRNSGTSGIRLAVEPSLRASLDNVLGILTGNLAMGMVQSDVQSLAVNRQGPFAQSAGTGKLRVLFSLYSEAFTVVVGKDSGIKAFSDLKGKRVAMGTPGASYWTTAELFMREYGWTTDDVHTVQDISADGMGKALCAGQVDAFIYAIGHPYAMIQDAVSQCGASIISLDGKERAAFMEKYAYYPAAVIPAGMYAPESHAVQTFGPQATLMASSNMPDDTAYFIVKTVFENFDAFKRMVPVFSELRKEDMVKGGSAPLHPGALRYFKEAGLL
jgi:TRAP transporter solute receptor, TAXI family